MTGGPRPDQDRPWRTGRSVGRTVYRQRGADPAKGDDLIGLMDSPELATQVVEAVNDRTDAAAELERLAQTILDNRPHLSLGDALGGEYAIAARDTRNRIAGHLRDRARELRGGHDGSGT